MPTIILFVTYIHPAHYTLTYIHTVLTFLLMSFLLISIYGSATNNMCKLKYLLEGL